MEAIILAGGFGKRLRSSVGDVPKPMASVNSRPFLDYLLGYLIENKVKSVIISVYYKYDIIKNHYGNNYKGMNISYSIDKEALGTGGAIKAALLKSNNKSIFIINGDSYFNVNLSYLCKIHNNNNNDITFSLKPMKNFDRYGFVKTDANGRVHSLKEKKYCDYGEIDGGVYLINKSIFNLIESKKKYQY